MSGRLELSKTVSRFAYTTLFFWLEYVELDIATEERSKTDAVFH